MLPQPHAHAQCLVALLKSRLRAQALMWACTRWAGAITPPLVLALVHWQGWRWAFVVLAVLGFVWAAVFFAWFRDDPATHPAVNAEELSLLQGCARHHDARRCDGVVSGIARQTRADSRRPVLLFLLRLVLLRDVAAFVPEGGATSHGQPSGGFRDVTATIRRLRLASLPASPPPAFHGARSRSSASSFRACCCSRSRASRARPWPWSRWGLRASAAISPCRSRGMRALRSAGVTRRRRPVP